MVTEITLNLCMNCGQIALQFYISNIYEMGRKRVNNCIRSTYETNAPILKCKRITVLVLNHFVENIELIKMQCMLGQVTNVF